MRTPEPPDIAGRPRIVAIVPMRHASERLPGKNYRSFNGRPLYHYIIETLLAVPEISQTFIDTDSEWIQADARTEFPSVVVLDRPSELRDGMVPMNDVLRNDVERIDADLYLQSHSTNPLLRPESVTRAINEFIEAGAAVDSLFSVTRLHSRLWTATGAPLNHDPQVLLRTQDLLPTFEENSCLYVFSRQSLETSGSRVGTRPMMYEIPADEAWDIDDETDFAVAEALHRARGVQ
jgi:CMP-N-acetylneuraminic acid synthetase